MRWIGEQCSKLHNSDGVVIKKEWCTDNKSQNFVGDSRETYKFRLDNLLLIFFLSMIYILCVTTWNERLEENKPGIERAGTKAFFFLFNRHKLIKKKVPSHDDDDFLLINNVSIWFLAFDILLGRLIAQFHVKRINRNRTEFIQPERDYAAFFIIIYEDKLKAFLMSSAF